MFMDFPHFGIYAKARGDINNQLSQRSINCFRMWGSSIERFYILCFMAPIMMEYFAWINCFFIPEDPCDVLFFDPSTEMLKEEAISKIIAGLKLSDDIPLVDLHKITYGDLVDRLSANLV